MSVIHDHPVQRNSTNKPGPAPVECPMCERMLDYDDTEWIGAKTLTLVYTCDACEHVVYHQYVLDAVTSVPMS